MTITHSPDYNLNKLVKKLMIDTIIRIVLWNSNELMRCKRELESLPINQGNYIVLIFKTCFTQKYYLKLKSL